MSAWNVSQADGFVSRKQQEGYTIEAKAEQVR
jgi:hypothetical protein